MERPGYSNKKNGRIHDEGQRVQGRKGNHNGLYKNFCKKMA